MIYRSPDDKLRYADGRPVEQLACGNLKVHEQDLVQLRWPVWVTAGAWVSISNDGTVKAIPDDKSIFTTS